MSLKKALLAIALLPSLVFAQSQPPSYLPKEVVRREKLLRYVSGKEINEGGIKVSVAVYREDSSGPEAVTQVVLHPLVRLTAEQLRTWWSGKLTAAPQEFKDKFLQGLDDLDEGEQAALTFYPGGGDVMMGTRDKVKFMGGDFRRAVLPIFE